MPRLDPNNPSVLVKNCGPGEKTVQHIISYNNTTARKLERRWRQRTHALRTAEAEPLHPADAQDDEFSKLLDGGVEQQSATDAVELSNRKLSSKNEVRHLPKSTPAAREARKGGKKQRKAQPKEQRRPEQQRRPLDDAAAVLRSAATFGVMRPLPKF